MFTLAKIQLQTKKTNHELLLPYRTKEEMQKEVENKGAKFNLECKLELKRKIILNFMQKYTNICRNKLKIKTSSLW